MVRRVSTLGRFSLGKQEAAAAGRCCLVAVLPSETSARVRALQTAYGNASATRIFMR